MVWVDTTASSLPPTWHGLKERLPQVGASAYVLFIVDNDAKTGQPWCPDVRAALPVLRKVFGESEKEVLVVSVGPKVFWKTPDNVWRTKWDITGVPALAKYTRTEDGVTRSLLGEFDFTDEEKVKAFLS